MSDSQRLSLAIGIPAAVYVISAVVQVLVTIRVYSRILKHPRNPCIK